MTATEENPIVWTAPQAEEGLCGTVRTAAYNMTCAVEKIQQTRQELDLIQAFLKSHEGKLKTCVWDLNIIRPRIELVCRAQLSGSDRVLTPAKDLAAMFPGYRWVRVEGSFGCDRHIDWTSKIDGLQVTITGAELVAPKPELGQTVVL